MTKASKKKRRAASFLPPLPPLPTSEMPEWYKGGNTKYLREDLVHNPMVAIMERIAVTQEKQAAFYQKYDKLTEPLMALAAKHIEELTGKKL